METITRHQKLEHLAATRQPVTEIFLNQSFVDRVHPFDDDQPLAVYYSSVLQKPVAQVGPAYDFEIWLHNSDDAKNLQEGNATLRQALPAYGSAIKHHKAWLGEYLEPIKIRLGERLDQLANQGHIPSVLAERYRDPRIAESYRFGVADSAYDATGSAVYNPDKDMTYFRPWRYGNRLQANFYHETFHRLSGSSTRKQNSKLFTSRIGLGTTVVGAETYIGRTERHRWLNEGVTEYLTNLAAYGNPGAIDPDLRANHDTNKYLSERKMVQILADRVGIDVLLLAYSEDYDPNAPNTLQHTRALMRAVRKAYGPGFLHRLDEIDTADGPERALDYLRAADYLAQKRDDQIKKGSKLGRIIGRLKRS